MNLHQDAQKAREAKELIENEQFKAVLMQEEMRREEEEFMVLMLMVNT